MKYYIDSKAGSDNNSGCSEKTPWKSIARANRERFAPGDSLYFRADGFYPGTLELHDSGTPDAPLKIGTYGDGQSPCLCGTGDVIRLFDVEHIEIDGLDLTNTAECLPLATAIRIESTKKRSGGPLCHIHIRNVHIHDFHVRQENNHDSAAIYIQVRESADGCPAWYEDIVIENCVIRNVDTIGIGASSPYGKRPEETCIPWAEAGEWTPLRGLVIRGCMISGCRYDGIFVTVTKDAVFEHNILYNNCHATNFSYAAMWPHNSDGCVMQYNEIYDTRLGAGDGQAFDVDINCCDCVVQYNYSHDNEGGFMLVCTDNGAESGGKDTNFNRGTLVRYNISQNDRNHLFSLYAHITGLKIYNNTFFTREGYEGSVFGLQLWPCEAYPIADVLLANNIFYSEAPGSAKWTESKPGSAEPGRVDRFTYRNNLFYGQIPLPKQLDDSNLTACDPMLVHPGGGGYGRHTTAAYKLKADSPCKGKGMLLKDNGGKDFFGTPVCDVCDIGACQISK